MAHPPGTVGVLSRDLAHYAWAMQSLRALQVPLGTQWVWAIGDWVSRGVNRLIAQMRPEDEWICLLTDDNPCPSNMLLRLLAHDVPIVAPLVCLRTPPFLPSLFHVLPDQSFRAWSWEELSGKHGLLAVDSFGGPGVVIRREVLEAIGVPFFENMPGPLGREDPREDLYTFGKCRAKGFQPLVDLDCCMGHCLPAVVTPTYDAATGRWQPHLWSRVNLGTLEPESAALDKG